MNTGNYASVTNLVIVPSFDLKPSAHDPMLVVPLDDFWLNFINQRVYGKDSE